jgi:hypothetical protein
MIVNTILINDMPYDMTEEAHGAAAEHEQHLRQWGAKYPGKTITQLRELDPGLASDLLANMRSFKPDPDCVRVTTSDVFATFHVNLVTGELEAINIELGGIDSDQFAVDDDLSPEDNLRARWIASSLGHDSPTPEQIREGLEDERLYESDWEEWLRRQENKEEERARLARIAKEE